MTKQEAREILQKQMQQLTAERPEIEWAFCGNTSSDIFSDAVVISLRVRNSRSGQALHAEISQAAIDLDRLPDIVTAVKEKMA